MIINMVNDDDDGGGSAVLTVISDVSGANVVAVCTAKTFAGVTGSDGTATLNVLPGYDYEVTVSKDEYSRTKSVHVDVSGATITLKIIKFGCTIVAIDESVADSYARCTYPDSVVINGKTYINSIPSSGFTEARGTSLNSWTEHKLIEDIQPVARDSNGNWITSGYSLTDSSTWDSSYDWFTEFPFRWMAWYKEESIVYILFSDNEENPDDTIFQDYAFLNNSNERKPNMHIGCFDGTNTSSQLYSKRTGANPTVSVSITNFIKYAKARGTDFDIITFYQMMYITGLFVTLYKTTDCQGNSNSDYGLGKGRVISGSVKAVDGVSFDNNYGMYGNKSNESSQAVFFWIHDIWGNVFDWVGGAKTDSSRRLITQTGKVSSVTESDFNNTALTPSLSSSVSGWCTGVAGGQKTGPFPITPSGGSGTTYYSDFCYVYASYFPYWGGYYGYEDNAGLFSWRFDRSASSTVNYLGTRLSYKGGRT